MTTIRTPEIRPDTPPARLPRLSAGELTEVLERFMPDSGLAVREVSPDRVVIEAAPKILECRPGGTLSGPTIFKVCDLSAFLAVNAYAGPVVTGVLVQGSIDLLEATEPQPLRIEVDVLQLGRRLAVATTRVTDRDGTLIAVATMRFSLPSRAVHTLPAR